MLGLLTVFYEPEKLFEEVGKNGKWLLPLLAALLTAVAITALTVYTIDMSPAVRTELESSPRIVQALGQEKIDEIVSNANSPRQKLMSCGGALVMSGLAVLVVAGVLFGLAQITDAGTSFKNVLAVSAYSSFAYGLVVGLGGWIVLMRLGDTSGVDMRNLVNLNPTLFLDRASTSKALYSLASSLDLLSFWRVFLLGLGLSKITPKMSLAKGLTLVILPWAVYVLLKVGWAAIF
ncbi:MAG: YIP1 family protein [Bryobacteraceae bacterium]|jgi:hypothetical protein